MKELLKIDWDDDSYDEVLYEEAAYHKAGQIIPAIFHGKVYPCRTLWRKIKHGAHKTLDFVKDHKTAFIVGGTVVVAVVATVVTVGAASAATAAAAGAAGVKNHKPSPSHHSQKEKQVLDYQDQMAQVSLFLYNFSYLQHSNLI